MSMETVGWEEMRKLSIQRLGILTAMGLAFALPCKPIAAAESIKVRSDFANLQAAADKGVIRVAALGGSITQNAKGHSATVPKWLSEKFPEAKIEAVNAGLSSTCSTTGAFRLQRDVLDKGAFDLLVVEFAVNDDQDAMHSRQEAIRGMEGIIRQVRMRSPATDILMVQYVNPGMLEKLQGGEVPVSIAAHEAVAEHYGITSINVAQALAEGAMDWATYGGTHPKAAGYELATTLMADALEKGLMAEARPARDLPERMDEECYDGAEFLDPQQAAWLGGWKWGQVSKALIPNGGIREDYRPLNVLRAEQPGTTLYLSFSGRAIGAFLLAGPDSGVVEVSVDAGEWRSIDTFHRFSKSLNYPRSVIFASGLRPGGHQLALRMGKRGETAGQGGDALNLLSFEVNR
jgi:lysophospholipase L1-like esterase